MNRPSPDDMKAMWVMEYVQELEEENKKLKEENKRLREGVDAGQKIVEDLISKNKKLKENIVCFINLFGFIGWIIFFEYMVFGYLPYCN